MTSKQQPLDLAQFEGHTPGPWEIEVDNRDGRSRGYIRKAEWAPGQYAIARAMQRNQQYHENAFLLAAAPALLAECKRQREETTRLRLIVERFAMYSPMGISADEQPEFARNVAKARAALAST